VDEFCRKRIDGTLSKRDFFEIYAIAHAGSMTASNILSAFSATGINPWDPSKITLEKIGPSLSTSIDAASPITISSFQKEQDFRKTDIYKQYQTFQLFNPKTSYHRKSDIVEKFTSLLAFTTTCIEDLTKNHAQIALYEDNISTLKKQLL